MAIEDALWSAVFTLAGAILLYVTTRGIEAWAVSPLAAFKEEAIATRINLLFYKNILTNHFAENAISEEWRKTLIQSQNIVRQHWAKLSTRYVTIPVFVRKLERKLPSPGKMKQIEQNLLNISNRSLIFMPGITSSSATDCKDSADKIDFIIEVLDKAIGN